MGENLRPQFDEIDGLINEVDAQTAKEQKALLAEIDDLSIEVDKGFDVMEQERQRKIELEIEKERRLAAAIEKLGKENVFGPNEVEKTFGVRLAEVPMIPFSVEDFERAKKLKQILVLRVDKTADGKPMSIEVMDRIISPKWIQEKKIPLLSLDREYRKNFSGENLGFTEKVPRLGWALVDKKISNKRLEGSRLNVIERLVGELRNQVFKGMEIPEEYAIAIEEFESNKSRLANSKMSQQNWDREFSALKITPLILRTDPEKIYDTIMYYDNNRNLLPVQYELNLHKTLLASSMDYKLGLGYFDKWDIVSEDDLPSYIDRPCLGASLSRRS